MNDYKCQYNEYDTPIYGLVAYLGVLVILVVFFNDKLIGSMLNVFDATGKISDSGLLMNNGTLFINGIATILLTTFLTEFLTLWLYTSSILSSIWHIISKMVIACIALSLSDFLFSKLYEYTYNKMEHQITFNEGDIKTITIFVVSLVIIVLTIFFATRSTAWLGARVSARRAWIYTIGIVVIYIFLIKHFGVLPISEYEDIVGVTIIVAIGFCLLLKSIFGRSR